MKRLVVLMVMALFTIPTFSQVSFGPKAGVNFSKVVYGEDLDERFDNLNEPFNIGLNAGIGADFGINDMFSVYTELIWTQKGSTYEGSFIMNDPTLGSITVREENDVTYNFIELPLLFRLKFGDITNFYINAGPSAGYWLGGQYEREYTLNGETGSIEADIKFKDRSEISGNENDFVLANEDINRLEWGAAIGAGVLFGLNSGKFNLDLRYTLGLSPIYEGNNDPDESWKNNVFSVSLGYFFGLADRNY